MNLDSKLNEYKENIEKLKAIESLEMTHFISATTSSKTLRISKK